MLLIHLSFYNNLMACLPFAKVLPVFLLIKPFCCNNLPVFVPETSRFKPTFNVLLISLNSLFIFHLYSNALFITLANNNNTLNVTTNQLVKSINHNIVAIIEVAKLLAIKADVVPLFTVLL